jgi:hypothetical protein
MIENEIPFTAKEYKEFIDFVKDKKGFLRSEKGNEKFEKNYLIAECPFCGVVHSERINNFNLEEFPYERMHGQSVNGDEVAPCEHYLIIDKFVNFNGFMPEISKYELNQNHSYFPEVPHIKGCFFYEPYTECKAVMRSLPVYKIVGDEFEPRYTAYIITYYSPVEYKEINMQKLIDLDYEGGFFGPPNDDDPDPESWWDLKRWVSEDKLYWMDTSNDGFQLMKKDVSKFPYGDIKGRKDPYWGMMPPY